MKFSTALKLIGFSLVILISINVFTALSAGIVVSPSTAGTRSTSVTANKVKPDACIGLNLSTIITGEGIVTGTPGNDLILGSAAADTIDGLGGDDCILGGSGEDGIEGNSGTDICLGGPGTDTFMNCEGETQ